MGEKIGTLSMERTSDIVESIIWVLGYSRRVSAIARNNNCEPGTFPRPSGAVIHWGRAMRGQRKPNGGFELAEIAFQVLGADPLVVAGDAAL